MREATAKHGGGPEHHGEDDGGAEDVRLEREIAVAESSANKNLKKDEEGVERNDGVDGGRTAVFALRKVLHPPAAGEEGDADEDGENDLGGAGMHDGQPIMEEFQDGEAAEDSLQNDSPESSEAEVADRRAFVVAPEERGEDDGQKA